MLRKDFLDFAYSASNVPKDEITERLNSIKSVYVHNPISAVMFAEDALLSGDVELVDLISKYLPDKNLGEALKYIFKLD